MEQEWIEKWQEGNLKLGADTMEWMRSRPDAVKAMMRKFPPSCLVRSTKGVHHNIPAPGTIGVIRSYVEPGDDHLNGELSVAQHPDSESWGRCVPGDLEVVGYYKGLTPEVVDALLCATALN